MKYLHSALAAIAAIILIFTAYTTSTLFEQSLSFGQYIAIAVSMVLNIAAAASCLIVAILIASPTVDPYDKN